jgi:excisionase family DNA binding protein
VTRKFHKVPEAAAELNVSPKTVRNWIAEGRLAVVRFSRAVRIPQSELDRLADEGLQPARRSA